MVVQVAASRAIVNVKNADLNIEVGIKEYAHPPFAVTTFEGIIAPLFLIGCESHIRSPDRGSTMISVLRHHLAHLQLHNSLISEERTRRRRHVSLRDSDERDCY